MQSDRSPSRLRHLHEAARDAFAIVAPTECSGCGEPDRALCTGCRGALRPHPRPVLIEADASSRPLAVFAALEYQGTTREVLLSYKDRGRTDAASALAGALRAAVGAALVAFDGHGVRLAAIPSSRRAYRERGYRPVHRVARTAQLGLHDHLRPVGITHDQATLGAQERRSNRSHALRATRAVRGKSYLLIDDIVTTGATLLDARDAIEAGGGRVLGAATIAFTARKYPVETFPDNPPELRGDFQVDGVYGWEKGVDDPPFAVRASLTSDQGGRHGHQHHRTQPRDNRSFSRVRDGEIREDRASV